MTGVSTLVVGSLRELRVIALVSGLAAAYGSSLFMAASILAELSRLEAGSTTGRLLDIAASVFILFASISTALVLVNGINTVIGGRLHQIALLRLLGAEVGRLRRALLVKVIGVATISAIVGAAIGTVGADTVRLILVSRGTLPGAADGASYPAVTAAVILAPLAVAATATGAAIVGSRAVLAAAPRQALSTHIDSSATRSTRMSIQTICFALILIIGTALLVLAAWMGEHTPNAFFLAFLGAAVASVGLLGISNELLPRLFSLFGRIGERTPTGHIARRNAHTDHRRTTRSTLGIAVGVTIISTITTGFDSLSRAINNVHVRDAMEVAEVQNTLQTLGAIIASVAAFSAVISVIGFASTMSLTVVGRTRELGLLRSMGFTAGQVQAMITREAILLAGTATALGLLVGIGFGTVGAQAMVGWTTAGFAVGIPWTTLLTVSTAAFAVAIVASWVPGRRAVAINPVAALAHAS